ncbi:MAG: ABC transporter ATP-binding protein [bacterium]|nr:ABC transporter ATP-binding protein [bacterium]MDE0239350.1 ABC transporter ATP-binding protein [bacterium]MDE0419215.1 ABC transporter ATP-binding protein [bacterium]
MSLLDVDGVTVHFGGVTALERVSFTVEPGEIFAIVGPNGAGKSTLFNLISRFHEPEEGDVRFAGESLLRRAPSGIAGLGIARTFQNIELFEHSSVLQNLLVGRHTRRRASILAQILFTPAVRREEIAHRVAVERMIDFLDLQPHRDRIIAGLPYGIRKVVEVARALAIGPRMLLLDEPASGLSAEESRDMQFRIKDIRARMGVTVLMVEHDMGLVSAVSDRVLALADGRVLAIGTPSEVQSHPKVIEAYLGTEAAAP